MKIGSKWFGSGVDFGSSLGTASISSRGVLANAELKAGGVDRLIELRYELKDIRGLLIEAANRLNTVIRGFDVNDPFVVFSEFPTNELIILIGQINSGDIGNYVNFRALAEKSPTEVASAIRASQFLPTKRPPHPAHESVDRTQSETAQDVQDALGCGVVRLPTKALGGPTIGSPTPTLTTGSYEYTDGVSA